MTVIFNSLPAPDLIKICQ